MRLTGFAFLLAFATPVLTFPLTKNYFIRIIANVYCHDVPVMAHIEINRADDDFFFNDHMESVYSPNNTDNYLVDTTIRGFEDKNTWHMKPHFFYRLLYDCGCGKYYDLPQRIPDSNVHDYEPLSKNWPFKLHVELSKCRRS